MSVCVCCVSSGVAHHREYLCLHQPHRAPRGLGAMAHRPAGAHPAPPPVHHVWDQLPVPAGKDTVLAPGSSHPCEVWSEKCISSFLSSSIYYPDRTVMVDWVLKTNFLPSSVWCSALTLLLSACWILTLTTGSSDGCGIFVHALTHGGPQFIVIRKTSLGSA